MSDHSGIPAINVFPPFGPAARPAPAPAAPPAPVEEASGAEDASELVTPTPAWEETTAGASTEEGGGPEAWDAGEVAAGDDALEIADDFAGASGDVTAADAGEAAAEAETAGAGDDDEDLPWLELPAGSSRAPAPEAASAPSTDRGFPDWMSSLDIDAGSEDDVVPIGDLEAAPGADSAAGAPRAEPETTDAATGESWAPADETPSDAEVAAEWVHPETAAAAPPPAQAPTANPAALLGGGAFDDVAARLEEIAHALREDPGAFLAGGGAGDPLSLLVVGFTLGVKAARGSGNS